jgi:prephenate dehydrogenase
MTNKTQQKFLFRNIIIIGLGMMGGSVAKACKKYGVSEYLFGFDIDEKQSEITLKTQTIDGIYDFKSLENDDLVIICSSLLSYENIFRRIKPNINNQTLIIDIGSLQDFALNISSEILQNKSKNFIACHPIAGSEKSGVQNSDADLFLDKKTIISQTKDNDKKHVEKIELFWNKIGSKTEFIDSKDHDRIFSLVSHLPQFLAFAAREDFQNGGDEILNRHFRLQNSNSKMWQEIFDLNFGNIDYYLQYFLKNIDDLVDLLEQEKYEELSSFINFQKNNEDGQNDDLKRVILVYCFLELPDIKDFEKYAGSGFKDFTAIAINSSFINTKILTKNKISIIQFLNNLKSRIHEFK